jgi:two-component system OmpR family response regulator
MSSGSVLVIEDDEWASQLLAAAIREAGYDVTVCHSASEGLEQAFATLPDCIVCDADLPDEHGHWVVRSVRMHASHVSVTPFLILTATDDEASRLEGFQVGADVFMTKPFRVDEVVAQVGALVHMASRLRRRRDTLLSLPPESERAPDSPAARAIEGDLGQISIATVLTVLEMERRTGTFEVVSKKRKAALELAGGCVIGASIGGARVPPVVALRTMLGWSVGRFAFVHAVASEERAPSSGQLTIGNFLLEAARLEDESQAGLPSRRAAQRSQAPVLGGPASSEDDLAPPSSRGFLAAFGVEREPGGARRTSPPASTRPHRGGSVRAARKSQSAHAAPLPAVPRPPSTPHFEPADLALALDDESAWEAPPTPVVPRTERPAAQKVTENASPKAAATLSPARPIARPPAKPAPTPTAVPPRPPPRPLERQAGPPAPPRPHTDLPAKPDAPPRPAPATEARPRPPLPPRPALPKK